MGLGRVRKRSRNSEYNFFKYTFLKERFAGEMAQTLKAITVLPEALSSVPSTYIGQLPVTLGNIPVTPASSPGLWAHTDTHKYK